MEPLSNCTNESMSAFLQSAEASGLSACRVLELVTNPPNLQNLKTSPQGGGFTLPLPPPYLKISAWVAESIVPLTVVASTEVAK